MAKSKKSASNSSSIGKKNSIPATSKKPIQKKTKKIDIEKAEVISEKIHKINKKFETLILECRKALTQLSTVQ